MTGFAIAQGTQSGREPGRVFLGLELRKNRTAGNVSLFFSGKTVTEQRLLKSTSGRKNALQGDTKIEHQIWLQIVMR